MGVALLPSSAGFIHMDGIAIRRVTKTDADSSVPRAHTVVAALEANANPAVQHFLNFVQAAATKVQEAEPDFRRA